MISLMNERKEETEAIESISVELAKLMIQDNPAPRFSVADRAGTALNDSTMDNESDYSMNADD